AAETDAAGKARLVTKPGSVRALVKINGREIPTEVFDIKETGGVLRVEAHWPTDGPPEATLDIVPRPGQVVYAEALVGTQTYRSRPACGASSGRSRCRSRAARSTGRWICRSRPGRPASRSRRSRA